MLSALLITAAMVAAEPRDLAPPAAKAEYEAARAKAGRDPDAHVRLALWCEAHGLKAEQLKHLALAVLADPTHATARGLLGLVQHGGKWQKPVDIAHKVQSDETLAANLAEYNTRRASARNTADSQWNLALWCEEKGLKAEATAHLTNVIRIDPRRSAAWKRLGFKRINGRWVRPEQIAQARAEQAAQTQANRKWGTRFITWKAALTHKDKARRDDAEKALASVSDPRAVPAVCVLFADGDFADQTIAVQLLGQIDTRDSSLALAILAVHSDSPDVRRSATETLTRRDPNDYMAPVIAGLQKLLQYQVKPVGGAGSPGILYVEGERFNRERIYEQPPPLSAVYGMILVPTWGYDDWGNFGPNDMHFAGTTSSTTYANGPTFSGAEMRHGLSNPNDPRAAVFAAIGGPNPNSGRGIFKAEYTGSVYAGMVGDSDFYDRTTIATTTTRSTDTVVHLRQNLIEYEKAAIVAQQQLRQDIAAVERTNQAIKFSNERLLTVLQNTTGQSFGTDRQAWSGWWAERQGYAYVPDPILPKQTIVEDIPVAYQPRLIGPTTTVGPVIGTKVAYSRSDEITASGRAVWAQRGFYEDCFSAGTPVQTLAGTRPIEDLKVGDQVLSQNTENGALSYQPVLTVYHFREPTQTIRLTFESDAVLTTPIHWFWISGRGWCMARDLKPGDQLRTLGGSRTLLAVEQDEVRPVFNLEVAGDADFFVGRVAVLAHDKTPTGRRGAGFDAVAVTLGQGGTKTAETSK